MKDFIAIKIAKIFKINFIIHWHFGRIPELFKKNNLEWNLFLMVFKSADKSIVLDKKSYDILNQYDKEKVSIIPNPIYEDLINKNKSFENNTKFIEKGTFTFVGHITPDKGVVELVKACLSVNFNIKLILIGPVSNSFKKEIIKLSSMKDEKFIIWKGELLNNEIMKYLNKSNALCLPSYTEGFPYVILEAMSVGCPIIASNVGAIDEMIL